MKIAKGTGETYRVPRTLEGICRKVRTIPPLIGAEYCTPTPVEDVLDDLWIQLVRPQDCGFDPAKGWGVRSFVGRRGVFYMQPDEVRSAIEALLPARAVACFGWLARISHLRLWIAPEARRSGIFGLASTMDGYRIELDRHADKKEVAAVASEWMRKTVAPADAFLALYLHECGHFMTATCGARRSFYAMRNESMENRMSWEADCWRWARVALASWKKGNLADVCAR